jgi:hypothetical protein
MGCYYGCSRLMALCEQGLAQYLRHDTCHNQPSPPADHRHLKHITISRSHLPSTSSRSPYWPPSQSENDASTSNAPLARGQGEEHACTFSSDNDDELHVMSHSPEELAPQLLGLSIEHGLKQLEKATLDFVSQMTGSTRSWSYFLLKIKESLLQA